MKQEHRINGNSLFWLLWGIYVVILAALFIYAQYAQRGTVNNPILNGDSTEIDLNGNVNQETESETTDQYCLHIRVKILKEISATCTNSGLTEGVICADCGEIIVEQIATARSTEHSFGEWLESSGRCSDIPYHFRVCRVCGEKEYDLTFTGVSHPCDYEFDLKEPTCIEDGYQKLVCKNCGYKAVDEIIEATGHDLKWTVDESTHSAYCKNQGCDYIISKATHTPSSSSVCVNTYCTVCDYLIKEGIGHNLSTEYLYDANSHWQACKNDNCNYTANYHRHINNSATCADQTAICNICGSEFVPKVNHVYGSWYITEEPTCTKKGLERRDCIYCNNYEERNTEATGHSCNNWNVTVEPTCIDYGIKKGFCNSCNAEISEKISPLGHSCQDWTVTKDMTCTEDGERIGRCSRCNKEFTEVIKATHSWSDTYSANDVSHWYLCLICNGTSSMEAHYGDGVCGSRAICSACGNEYGDIIQHDFSTSVSYDESSHYNLCNRGCGTQANVEVHQLIGKTETMTITDAGGEVVYSHKLYLVCNGCDYKRLYDETEAHEHYGCEVYESVAPTCTKTGLTFGWGCSVEDCGEVYKPQEIIEALGHDYDINYTCNRCGYNLYSTGLDYVLNDDEESYSLTSIGTCNDTNIEIPPTYNGLPVTSVASEAFKNCMNLEGITIPDSIISIGKNPFIYCHNLESIIVNENNTKYHSDGNCLIETESKILIAGCRTSVIPTDCSITSIGSYAFSGCSSLTSIMIPDSVTSIGDSAFYYCRSLTSITIPDSVTSIGDGAFQYCYKLIEVYNLSSLTITAGSSSNGYVGYYAKNVYTDESVASKLVEKDGYIFYCTDDTSEYYLMGYTGSDIELALPDNFNGHNYEIYQYAFYCRDDITSITIPNNVTNIHECAFNGCYSLIQEENGVYYVDKWIVDCDSYVTHVTLRENTVGIGDFAFEYCTNLTSITISDHVTGIGDYAFSNCYNLTSVVFGENSQLASIGDGAFYRCESLTNITIPDSVTNIGDEAFFHCYNLTSIFIPGIVTSIGDGTFSMCERLTSITLPGSVKNIEEDAFRGCSSLTSITIPDSVESVGGYAFYGCDSLTSVVFGESSQLTSIGNCAFEYCGSLTSISFGENSKFTNIGNYAFESCTSLTSIIIPDSITSIGDNAFDYCYELATVYYTGTEEEWAVISIGSDNSYLTDATIIYNYVPEE